MILLFFPDSIPALWEEPLNMGYGGNTVLPAGIAGFTILEDSVQLPVVPKDSSMGLVGVHWMENVKSEEMQTAFGSLSMPV